MFALTLNHVRVTIFEDTITIQMKVVIPRKTTSDRHLQTPNDDLTRDFVYTHQEYRKVTKLVQNRHNVENSKIAVNQHKFIFYRKS